MAHQSKINVANILKNTRLKRISVHKRELNVDNIGKYSDGRSPSTDAVSKSYFTYGLVLQGLKNSSRRDATYSKEPNNRVAASFVRLSERVPTNNIYSFLSYVTC